MTDTVEHSQDDPRTPFREWPAVGRWTVSLVLALVLLLIVGFIGTTAIVRRSFPQTQGTITLARLTGAVDVRRDDLGVPQVRASDARDLFLAQGYVQAQDRFFQMDIARHRAAGRLSELLGRAGLAEDLTARTLGWEQLAEAEYGELAPTTQSYLRAFSEGVNAYLRDHSPSRLSVEYPLLELAGLNDKPDSWTPVDSLAILKADTATWSTDIRTEVDRARLLLDRSPEQVAELYPRLPAATDAFVVPGSRTASGSPLLADAVMADPGLPSAWIQVGLSCRTVTPTCPFDVSGATLPGVPGVLAGHNEDVAWGLTTSTADSTDLFLEKVEDHSYLRGNEQVPLTERDEVIRIQGADPKRITVRSTSAGPLLSDVSAALSSVGANARVPDGSPARGNGYAVALASTSLVPARAADGLFALASATDSASLQAAATQFALPGHDLLFADRQNRTGRIELGPLPRRGTRSGLDAVPAWTGGGWPTRYGAARVLDTGSADAVLGGNSRIRALLDARHDWTATGVSAIQSDTRSPLAGFLVPALLKVLMTSQYYAEGQRLLADWNGLQPADSAAAAYLNAVWENLLRLTFHDQLKESLWPDGDTRWMVVVRQLLTQPNSPWWDDADTDDVVEDRDTVLGQALRDARDEMTQRVARDTGGWSWGELHQLPLDRTGLGDRDLGLLSELIERGPYGVGGGPGTAAGTTYDAADSLRVTRAPAVRMISDLGDPDGSRWVSMTGASGHAFSPHYRDQFESWRTGTSYRWVFTDDAVRRSAVDVLRLTPRSGAAASR